MAYTQRNLYFSPAATAVSMQNIFKKLLPLKWMSILRKIEQSDAFGRTS